MSVLEKWQTIKVLIVVKTYPTPARKGLEVCCTAGITETGEWIRLFPISFRFLEQEQQFGRYQWIEVRVQKASDTRPESYEVDLDSIRKIGAPINTKKQWADRRELVEPLRSHCLCCLKQARDKDNYPTLGFFKPKEITSFSIEDDDVGWSEADLARLNQPSFFGTTPVTTLEKIPYRFKYQFRCDHETCNGHSLTCSDWEISQAYRKYKRIYGNKWREKFLEKFENQMVNKFDTHFFVGTVHIHPQSWIIVGLYYPTKALKNTESEQLALL